jgi:hypothetical protein
MLSLSILDDTLFRPRQASFTHPLGYAPHIATEWHNNRRSVVFAGMLESLDLEVSYTSRSAAVDLSYLLPNPATDVETSIFHSRSEHLLTVSIKANLLTLNRPVTVVG